MYKPINNTPSICIDTMFKNIFTAISYILKAVICETDVCLSVSSETDEYLTRCVEKTVRKSTFKR